MSFFLVVLVISFIIKLRFPTFCTLLFNLLKLSEACIINVKHTRKSSTYFSCDISKSSIYFTLNFFFSGMKYIKIKLLIAMLTIMGTYCQYKREAIIQEFHLSQKYICQYGRKRALFASSELHCVNRCLREDACDTINFFMGDTTDQFNCEVLSRVIVSTLENSKQFKINLSFSSDILQV